MGGEGHAQQHFEATSHTYALEVSTQRVWDYAGNGYVHRLLYNHQDGKMVEHSIGSDSSSGLVGMEPAAACADDRLSVGADMSGFARGEATAGDRHTKKQESIVSEFNALLSSQMTAQRRYYEERQREQ